MELTFYGHSCFLLDTGNHKLLFDPFITPNELAKDIDVNSIDADFMLISHGHEDHVADAVDIAKRTDAKVISNFEIVNWFAEQGVENGHPMNHGGNWNFDFGTVKYVNAIHSSVLPDGTYGGNPGGFVVTTGGKEIYYAGDTALTYDMKLIAETTKLDWAILPIGDNFTMGVEDGVKAAGFVKCDQIIGMHYDTFGFIEIDHDAAKDTFKRADKTLHLLDIGSGMKL